jgi:deoxycytidylate deaminase
MGKAELKTASSRKSATKQPQSASLSPSSTTLSFDLPGAEFIFAIVAPVGTDTGGVVGILETALKKYQYKPTTIRISNFLDELDLGIPVSDQSEYLRIKTHMDAGNEACRRSGRNDFLALAASAAISKRRPVDEQTKKTEPLLYHAHILISLKRREEVLALRRIYGAGFLLISVFATDEERKAHLARQVGMTAKQAIELIERDRNEADPHGQATRDTFHLADIFVRLAKEDYKEQLPRFVDSLLGYPFHTPTEAEQGMFFAFNAGLRSADLSRQVGAALFSVNGEVLAVGCNDVPKAGGGLYWPGPGDQRDHIRGEDANQIRRDKIVAEIIGKLRPEIPKSDQIEKGLELLKGTSLMDLTEFGRPVHAEMDAILSAERGGISARGGTLYSTTFPCHNCTRHIIAAGIKRVVYIEPYPKSKAEELHFDAIRIEEHAHETAPDKESTKVSFESFVGVGPRRYEDLFATTLNSGKKLLRKQKDGRKVGWATEAARPRVPMLPNSYLERELVASDEIEAMMQ